MRIDSPIITGSFSVNGDSLLDLNTLTTTGSNTFIGDQTITGSLAINDSATNFLIEGNSFGQTYLTAGGAIVLNPGYGGVEMVGSNRTFKATDITAEGFVSGEIRANNGVVSGSSQVVGILSSLNSYTGSNDTKWTSIGNLTGSYATTGSNTFKGTTIISGSTFIQGDFTVFGSSSIQYISASSVSIGTNIVTLNTANPAVRYAGISVQDSGSATGVTGSMLWDSTCNRWIYSNPSGVGYSGGIIMSGPRAATFGQETTLTCNYVAKSGGGDHLYDSCIIDDGTTICVKGNFVGTGTACFASDLILAATNGNIYGGTTAGSTIISNIGGQTYARFYGASHATTPNTISFINASSTSAIINASGDTCFANNVCALNLISRCNIRVGVNGGYAVISGPTTGAAISLGSNSSTFDRNLSLGIVGGDLSFSPILTINAQTANVGIGDCTPDRRLYVNDTSVTQGTFLAYNRCSTFCGTVIEGITDRTSNSGFNLMNLKSSTTSMFMVRGDGLACFAGTVSVGGTIKATTGLLSSGFTPYTYNDQFEIQNEGAWRLRFQAYHNGAGYDYRVVQNNNGSDICVMTFICGRITVNQTATFCNNVGIGTSNPTALLQVSSASGGIISLNSTTTNSWRGITFQNNASSDSTEYAYIKYNATSGEMRYYANPAAFGGYTTFYSNNTESMRITSAGVVCFANTICTPNASIGCINSYNGIISSNGVITKSIGGTMVGATATYFDFPTWDDSGQGQMFEIKAFFDHFYNWGYGAHYYVYLTTREGNSQALTMFNCTTGNGGSWMAYKTSPTNLRVCKVAGTYGGGGAYWIQVTAKQP